MSERSITYGQLRDQCRALAVRLQKNFGLKFGDTIAVCLPNMIEFPVIFLAGSEGGITITTVNPIYTPRKLITWIYSLEIAHWFRPEYLKTLCMASDKIRMTEIKSWLPITRVNTVIRNYVIIYWTFVFHRRDFEAITRQRSYCALRTRMHESNSPEIGRDDQKADQNCLREGNANGCNSCKWSWLLRTNRPER